MSRPQFVNVLQEMRSRYSTGVPHYVHSFINGMIVALEQYGILDDSEAQNLRVANSQMLEVYYDKVEK